MFSFNFHRLLFFILFLPYSVTCFYPSHYTDKIILCIFSLQYVLYNCVWYVVHACTQPLQGTLLNIISALPGTICMWVSNELQIGQSWKCGNLLPYGTFRKIVFEVFRGRWHENEDNETSLNQIKHNISSLGGSIPCSCTD